MPNRGSLTKIHIAKKDLGLSDEEYRDILRARFRKDSAAKLSQPLASNPMSRKVRAIWLELANAGVVRNKSEQALLTFVKNQIKVDRLQWASTGQKAQVIEALKDWGKRKGVNLD